MIFDEFFGGEPFPIKRKNYEFVGQVFDEEEITVDEHVDVLRKFYNGK
jgi:hypothetical protein